MKTQTQDEQVGHYFCSHGFLRSYHGADQIGSTARSEDLGEYHTEMCGRIQRRLNDGRRVVEFFGGYYAHPEAAEAGR